MLRKNNLTPEFCTKCRSEAPKTLYLKRSWNDFDPQAYCPYEEDQNRETPVYHTKALQAIVDSWCKIQVGYSERKHDEPEIFRIHHRGAGYVPEFLNATPPVR